MEPIELVPVVIESPFSARKPDGSWDAEAVEENLEYVRAAMHDCFSRGEAPFASHALYTQPGVLDDRNPAERRLGMSGGFEWNKHAVRSVVYVDRGFSQGMKDGIVNAVKAGRSVEARTLADWSHGPDGQPIGSEAIVDQVFAYWQECVTKATRGEL